MANWVTPKTDWTAASFFNIEDYSRWVNNLNYLKELATEVFKNFDYLQMTKEKQYISDVYASEVNAIEKNLELLNVNTYNLDIGDTAQFAPNGRTIAYEEMNRLEKAMERLFNTLYGQLSIAQHLEIQLTRKQLGKRTKYSKDEINDYRLGFRLGIDKGVIR